MVVVVAVGREGVEGDKQRGDRLDGLVEGRSIRRCGDWQSLERKRAHEKSHSTSHTRVSRPTAAPPARKAVATRVPCGRLPDGSSTRGVRRGTPGEPAGDGPSAVRLFRDRFQGPPRALPPSPLPRPRIDASPYRPAIDHRPALTPPGLVLRLTTLRDSRLRQRATQRGQPKTTPADALSCPIDLSHMCAIQINIGGYSRRVMETFGCEPRALRTWSSAAFPLRIFTYHLGSAIVAVIVPF